MEAAADVGVEDFLSDDWPDDLSAGLDAQGVVEPSFVVGELSAMKIHAAEPDEHHSQVAEVRTENFTRYVF